MIELFGTIDQYTVLIKDTTVRWTVVSASHREGSGRPARYRRRLVSAVLGLPKATFLAIVVRRPRREDR